MLNRFSSALIGALMLCSCGSPEPILIGLAGPVSQERGVSMRLAAELAVSQINAEGGVGGRPLQLVVRDDSAQSDAAIRVAQDLYDTPDLVAVIGHLTSGTTLAAASIYNGGSRPVVEISPSASSPEISSAGPYTFRTCPSDLVHGRRLARWAREVLNTNRAAILYQNDDYGRGIRNAFSASFAALEGVVAADFPYVPELPDFEPLLSHVQQRGRADVLLIAGTLAAAERIIPIMDSIGLDLQVMAGDGVTGLQNSSVNAFGTLISSAYLPDRPGQLNDEFVGAYRAAYNSLPDHRGAGAYDIVHLLARAIEEVGASRPAVRDYLAGVGLDSPAFEGVTGRIVFDANGDVPQKEVLIGVVATTGLVTVRGQ
jgi:branched-chain amino acid transport system substrate-binding protein